MMSKSPEPIILAVALLVLALGAAWLAYSFPSAEEITGVTSLEPKGHGTALLKAEDIASNLTIWDSPTLWQEPADSDNHRLFDSAPYLFYPSAYPAGDYIKKFDKTTRSPSGVLLWWYQKYRLDFTDPNVDREDPDNDGFSNIVEFKNDPVGVRQKASDCDGSKSTNPLDPKDHPSYLSRLRLQRYELRPFHILFNGYNQVGGEYVFQLYLKDVESWKQPPMKKSGEELGLEDYKVGAFHQIFKDELDPGTGLTSKVDESTLELDKPGIGFKVVLPLRKEIDSPESTADFVMLMPDDVDKVIKISRGKIFTISYLPGSSFLLISTDENGATISDTKTKQEYSIPKLDPAEWNEVPQSSAAKSP
jgi:hypothetical protein